MAKNTTIVEKTLETAPSHMDEMEDVDLAILSEEPPMFMYAFRNSPECIIFVGHDTEACRQKCLADLKESGFLKDAIKELMHFSSRSRRAVCRWLFGEALPQRADWLLWQYWLRAKGYYTQELDNMPNCFFQLRKHIVSNDISFAVAAFELGWTQEVLWAVLNNEMASDYAFQISAVGKVYSLITDINLEITQQDINAAIEMVLDPDPEVIEARRRLGLVAESDSDRAARIKRKAKQNLRRQFWQCQSPLPEKQQGVVDLLMRIINQEDNTQSLLKVRVKDFRVRLFRAAKKAGISRTTCRRAIGELRKRGIIKPVEKGSNELIICRVKFREASQD